MDLVYVCVFLYTPLHMKLYKKLYKIWHDWFLLEDGPGIEGFQIIGDAIPGGKLQGCGFPVRGTSLCMFQVKSIISYNQIVFVSSNQHIPVIST